MRDIQKRLERLEQQCPPSRQGRMIDISILDPAILALWQAVDFDITRLPTDELELLDEELGRHL
jgi:hypothetical protein